MNNEAKQWQVLDLDGVLYVTTLEGVKIAKVGDKRDRADIEGNAALIAAAPETAAERDRLREALERVLPALETAAHLMRLHGDKEEAAHFDNDASVARTALNDKDIE